MSNHNIGFYEDLTKIIFELSSNIIKYAPYFFCWIIPCKDTKENEKCHDPHLFSRSIKGFTKFLSRLA